MVVVTARGEWRIFLISILVVLRYLRHEHFEYIITNFLESLRIAIVLPQVYPEKKLFPSLCVGCAELLKELTAVDLQQRIISPT